MKQVKVLVLSGNGINCEREMAFACEAAGADQVDIVHVAEILSGRVKLADYHFLNLPGGFCDGDDLGSAKAQANRLRHAPISGSEQSLADQIKAFIADGKLVLGICNGFQMMVKLGLLPAIGGTYGQQSMSLTFNDGGRFEDRWTYLAVDRDSPCVFTKGLERLYFPVRHGEGKLVAQDSATLQMLEDKHLSVLKYAEDDGVTPTMEYPLNPNGSQNAIAGLCDETGRCFGLMPHPEAYLHRTHHPRWTREELPDEGMGLWLFQNAIQTIREEIL